MKRPCEPLTQATSSTFHVLRLTPHVFLWSGRWDLNPRQPAWKAGTLPLSYARPSLSAECAVLSSKPDFSFAQHSSLACVNSLWWAGKDSNLGSRWQQIYSLPPLATWVPARNSLHTTQKLCAQYMVVFFHPDKEERTGPHTAHPSL